VILGHKRRTRLALFEKHLGWARSLGRSVAKGLPPSFDVADLEQVAAAEHWKQTGLYDPARGVPYQGFALQAIRGACYMSVRRDTYRDSTMEELSEGLPAGKDSDPEELAQRKEAMSRVLAVLARLKSAHRRVLEMHYLDGLPLTECGRRMGRRDIYDLKEEAMREMRQRLAALTPAEAEAGERNWAGLMASLIVDANPGRSNKPAPVRRHKKPNADEQAGDWGEDAMRGQDG